MSLKAPQIAICSIGVLHVLFMLGELFPLSLPKIMGLVVSNWPKPLDLSPNDQEFAAMIVHNAGIYNGIVAAGLFAAAWTGPAAYNVQVTLLAGGIVAGLFGAATLSTKTVVQAILGAIALVVVIRFHAKQNGPTR